MSQSKNSFRHESLQDSKSIQDIIKSINKGLARGKLNFSDEDGEITMEPEGLLNLKITADRNDNRHRLNIRISWQIEEKIKSKKKLSVNDSD